MFRDFVKRTPVVLESEIDRIHALMLNEDPKSEEYQTLLNTFERLLKLQDESRTSAINPNTLLVVGGNVVCVLIVVGYERGHIVASRALQFFARTQ
jgi:hypothetical protein